MNLSAMLQVSERPVKEKLCRSRWKVQIDAAAHQRNHGHHHRTTAHACFCQAGTRRRTADKDLIPNKTKYIPACKIIHVKLWWERAGNQAHRLIPAGFQIGTFKKEDKYRKEPGSEVTSDQDSYQPQPASLFSLRQVLPCVSDFFFFIRKMFNLS